MRRHNGYQLVIRNDLFLQGFSRLANDEIPLMWGRITRSYHRMGCDLIVSELVYSNTLPSGKDLTPLFDWIVIHQSDELDEDAVLDKLKSSNVRLGQLMVYFQPGIGEAFDQWVGVVVEHRKIQPLNSIVLVGPGLQRIQRKPRRVRQNESVRNPTAQMDQWSRLRGALGKEVFARFRQNEIVLVGCGRLGSSMAAKLVRAGLRRITLIDPDNLEPHNRDITVGNQPKDIGKSKAIVLAKTLHRIRPAALITAINRPVQDKLSLEFIRRSPVVITCVDNDESRRHVASVAADLLRIHLDIGTIVAFRPNQDSAEDSVHHPTIAADVRLTLPGACIGCIGGLTEEESEKSSVESWNSGGRIGSIPSITSIAVGTALQIYFDFLAERITHSFWQRISWNGLQGLSTLAGPVSGDRNCAVCGSGRFSLNNSRP